MREIGEMADEIVDDAEAAMLDEEDIDEDDDTLDVRYHNPGRAAALAATRTPFREEYVEQARKLSQLGATMGEIADFFEVSVSTLYQWRYRYEDFHDALAIGRDHSNARVERSLYERATGYSYVEERIVRSRGKTVDVVAVNVHVPADVRAAEIWLSRRDPERWAEKKNVDDGELSLRDAFGVLIRQIQRSGNRIGPFGTNPLMEISNEQHSDGEGTGLAGAVADDVAEGHAPSDGGAGAYDPQPRRSADAAQVEVGEPEAQGALTDAPPPRRLVPR